MLTQHPNLFPDYRVRSGNYSDEMPPAYRQGEQYRDNWGCVWYNVQEGLEGVAVEHPLADWSALDTYQPPDPLTKTERGDQDWEVNRRNIEAIRAAGGLTAGNGQRLFDRLYFLRGLENLMMDIVSDDSCLPRRIHMISGGAWGANIPLRNIDALCAAVEDCCWP